MQRDLWNEANAIKDAPSDAWTMLVNRIERLETIRARAYSTGAIRYDKDRVQSSPPKDPLCDTVIKIIDAEDDVKRAYNSYNRAYKEFALALQLAGFDDEQELVWLVHYGGQHRSFGKTAKYMRSTRSRVQYLLTNGKFEEQFTQGVQKYKEVVDDEILC